MRDPAAVRREGRLPLIERRLKEELRLARLGVLRVAHAQGQCPEIERRIHSQLGEGEPLAVGGKRVWSQFALTFQQQLRFSRPVGANPAYGIAARSLSEKSPRPRFFCSALKQNHPIMFYG